MPQRKCSDLIDGLYTWSESTNIALKFSFLQTEGLFVPPVLSLSSRYSCNNELNHISDATEDHEHGQKTLCYGATYSFLSFCPFQNLFLSLILISICLCFSTCLFQPCLPKNMPHSKAFFSSFFSSSANPSDRHIFFNTHPKPPVHNCSIDLDLNSEPPFSLHPIAPIMQIF